MSTEHYVHGITGWVGRSERTYENRKPNVSWWFGPNSGWGTTYGELEYSTTVFKTKAALIEAARSVYGRAWTSRFTPQRVADAERELFDHWIAWWTSQCERAEVKPFNRLSDKTIATRIVKRHGGHESPYRIGEERARYEYAMAQRETTESSST